MVRSQSASCFGVDLDGSMHAVVNVGTNRHVLRARGRLAGLVFGMVADTVSVVGDLGGVGGRNFSRLSDISLVVPTKPRDSLCNQCREVRERERSHLTAAASNASSALFRLSIFDENRSGIVLFREHCDEDCEAATSL